MRTSLFYSAYCSSQLELSVLLLLQVKVSQIFIDIYRLHFLVIKILPPLMTIEPNINLME